MLQNSYKKVIGGQGLPQKLNPNDPMSYSKIKGDVEKQSGGRKTIKSIGETQGMGIYGDIDPGGYGYTVVETESEKAKRDPNSAYFKQKQQQDKQKKADEEMKRYWEKKKFGGMK